MKHLKILLFCSVALFGCSFNQLQNDYADNQYFGTAPHADSTAPYIGEWAAGATKWVKILRIRDNGKIKVVLAPGFGACDGKVYLNRERPFLILKDGTKAKIVAVNKDYLLIEAYGKREKFYSMPKERRLKYNATVW